MRNQLNQGNLKTIQSFGVEITFGKETTNWILFGWFHIQLNVAESKSYQSGDWYKVSTEWNSPTPSWKRGVATCQDTHRKRVTEGGDSKNIVLLKLFYWCDEVTFGGWKNYIQDKSSISKNVSKFCRGFFI